MQEEELPTEDEEDDETSSSSCKASKASTRSLPSQDFPSLLSLNSPARANGNESEIDNNLETSRENGSGRRRRNIAEIGNRWNHHHSFRVRNNVSTFSSPTERDSEMSLERNGKECYSEASDDTEQETQDYLDSVFGLDLETPKAWARPNFPTVPGQNDQSNPGNNNLPNNNIDTYDRDEIQLLESDIRDRALLAGSGPYLNGEDGNGTRARMVLQKGSTTPVRKMSIGPKQCSSSSSSKLRRKSVEEENGFHPALQNYASRRSSGREEAQEDHLMTILKT